jgi:hypothetical protein
VTFAPSLSDVIYAGNPDTRRRGAPGVVYGGNPGVSAERAA